MLCSSWKFQYIGYWVRFCSWTTALLSSDSLQLWQYLPAQSLNVMQNNRTGIATRSTLSPGMMWSAIYWKSTQHHLSNCCQPIALFFELTYIAIKDLYWIQHNSVVSNCPFWLILIPPLHVLIDRMTGQQYLDLDAWRMPEGMRRLESTKTKKSMLSKQGC